MSVIIWLKKQMSSTITSETSPLLQTSSCGPTLALFRDEITNLFKAPDPQIVLVDSQWFQQLATFLQSGPKPLSMNSSTFITKSKKLRKGSKLGVDFFFISKKVWERLKSPEDETINLEVNRKLKKLDFLALAESHKALVFGSQETSRFDPTDIHLPSMIPRNEHVERFELATEVEDLLKESESTGPTTAGMTESDSSNFLSSIRLLRGRVGLENPGLYCYLNASLQCLLSITRFNELMIHEFSLGKFIDKEASELVAKLIISVFSMRSGVVKPTPLWKYIEKFFPSNKQHDMPELFRFIINQIETEIGEKNPIKTQVLNGVLCSNVTCKICLKSSKKFEDFIDLQIELSESIEKSLQLYVQDEVLSSEFYCSTCKTHTQALKALSISKAPFYLVLQIKRFRQVPYPHKLTSFTKYRRRLIVVTEEANLNYELVAIGVHIGSINSGHYVAYAKRSRSWYCFDDSVCTKVTIKSVLSQHAYMLIYKLI